MSKMHLTASIFALAVAALISNAAYAEYYLVHGRTVVVTSIYTSKISYHRYHRYHHPHHHVVRYVIHHCCAWGCGSCFNPLQNLEGGPVYLYPVYSSYYDNYDPDLATGDDDQVRHPAMEISY